MSQEKNIREKIIEARRQSYKEPNNIAAIISLAHCLCAKRKYGEAIKWFEKALQLERKNIKAISGLANAFLKCGLLFSARKYFERSLTISPHNSLVHKILSKLRANPVTQKRPVTFYVPCYNAGKYIAECIEGILAQSYPVAEILIIDDGSTDKTVSIAKKYPVRIIRHKANMGLASARNTAIKNASGDYIASVDADVTPDKYWLEYLMSNFINDTIGGIGGKLLEEKTLTAVDRWRQVHMPQNWGDKEKINTYFLSGCDTVYRKKCLEEVGGYDEKFKTNYEDVNLSFRIKMLGYKIIYNPCAIAHHIRTDNIQSLLNTAWRHFKTQDEISGAFNDFNALTSRINYRFGIVFDRLKRDIEHKRFQLLYIDLLYGFWSTLEDIIHSGRYSKIPKDIATQTFLATLIGFRDSLIQKKGVSQELIDFVLEDLESLMDPLEKEHGSCIKEDLRVISGKTSFNFQKKYKKIKSIFPHADFKFVHLVLDSWSIKFNLEPLTWKMMEVSAKRVHYEEKCNPNFMPGFRVMLLNPPWREGSRCGIRAGSRWPFTMDIGKASIPGYVPFPFFLAYATALLKKNGINAVIVDAIAEGLSDEEFLERVRGSQPDLVLIEAATASIENDLKWAEKIKGINGSTKIVFVGTHVSALGARFLSENPDIDYLIVGEYELALLELSRSLEKNEMPKNVLGVVYRDKNGKVVSNGRTAGISKLDDLPFPERITLPIYNYNDFGGTGTPNPTVQAMASRGCPFGCIFCLWPQVLYGNRKYRFNNPIRVVDEMGMLIKDYGFKGIYFDDDTFNIGKDRILKICKEIKRRNIKVPWAIMARADTSDYQTLKAMKDAGMCALKFGVESASQELVDSCGKGLNLGTVEKAVKNCKRLGIRVHLAFTFGLPGETRKTIRDTIDLALKLDPDSTQFSLTTPFPGTKYYNILDEKGLLATKDWRKYDGNRYTVIRGENLSAKELERALKTAQRKWDIHHQQRKLDQAYPVLLESQRLTFKECKGKIAIVDLKFTWPPSGGASCSINELATHLVKEGFIVEMFVPFYNTYFPCGYIREPLLFPVQQIEFDKKTFTPEIISKRFRKSIDIFDPDYVIVGDGRGLKPYIIDALSKYKIFLRFFAYENLCLIQHGVLFRDGRICPYNFLDHREKCLECVNKELLEKGLDHLGVELHELLLNRAFTKDFHGLVKKSLRQACGVIVSGEIGAKIVRSFNRKVYIIPQGIDIDKFCVTLDKKPGSFRKNIFMSGRVTDHTKGFQVLKEACEKLWKMRKDFVVTVTRQESIEKEPSFLRSVGWVSYEKMPSLYEKADICVFPSVWPEPFGRVAVEAMTAGKPVIASRIGGLKDIVVDGKTGFLVKPGDADELAKKIDILLDNPKLRDSMGKNGRERAERFYDWNTIIKKYYLPLFSNSRKRKTKHAQDSI